MTHEAMKAYQESNQTERCRIYTVPQPGAKFTVSQIEGMSLFTLALAQAQQAQQAQEKKS